MLTSCKENVKAQVDDKTDIVQEDEFKKSNDFKFYHNRGISKGNSKDYKGAMADFTKVIEINPNYAKAYFNRGNAKAKLEDYKGAIIDFTRAIDLVVAEVESDDDELDSTFLSLTHYSRGISKMLLENFLSACIDFRVAQKLGYDASEAINLVCK